MKFALITNFRLAKNIPFYSHCAINTNSIHNWFLLNIQNKIVPFFCWLANNSRLEVFHTGTTSIMVLIDNHAFQVIFLNIFYSLDLEYNLVYVVIIEKANYFNVVKDEKRSVFDDENKMYQVLTWIDSCYLFDLIYNKIY